MALATMSVKGLKQKRLVPLQKHNLGMNNNNISYLLTYLENVQTTYLEDAKESESNFSGSETVCICIFSHDSDDGCQQNGQGTNEFIVACVPSATQFTYQKYNTKSAV